MMAAPAECDSTPKRVPPEGGWGYFVMAGMSTCLILTLGVLPCFGLLFGEFLDSLGAGAQTVALVTSTFFMSSSVAGLFMKILLERFSMRTVGCCTAIVFCGGGLLTVIMTSVPQLIVAYGIMQGTGFGVMSTIAYASFNRYFVHRRVLMMGLAQTLVGLGSVGLPLLIVQLVQLFGHRGCLAVMAAINGHVLVAMLVMHPAEWHLRREKRSEVDLMVIHPADYEPVAPHDDESLSQNVVRNSATPTRECIRRSSSENIDPTHTGSFLLNTISKLVDVSLLSDLVYLNIGVGMSLALYSDIAFFTFQPMYLFHLGYSQTAAAHIIAIGAASDVASRFALGVSSTWVKVSARTIFLAGAVATIAARLVFFHVAEFTAMAAITGVLGFFRAWLHVPISLIIADHLPAHKFPSGHGMFMFMQGVIVFVLGPCVGWVRDITESFAMLFMCLGVAMAICAVSWTIEMAFWRGRK